MSIIDAAKEAALKQLMNETLSKMDDETLSCFYSAVKAHVNSRFGAKACKK